MSDESMSSGAHTLLDVAEALSILGSVREEISGLEHEFASLDADCDRVRASIPAGVGSGSTTTQATLTVQCFIDERLAAEREAMRVQIDDARRVATERVRRAEHEAAELVRLARAEVFDRLLEGPVGPARARPVVVTGALHPLDAPGPSPAIAVLAGASAADVHGGAQVVASAAVPEGAQVAARVAARVAVPEDAVAADDDGFRGFWQEADEAAQARSLALVSFSAVLPALSALLLIVFSLLFVI